MKMTAWLKAFFFPLYAGLFQVLFLLSCTVYRDVILVPGPPWCPPVTKDYWFWLLDERLPAVPYEDQLLSFCFVLVPLSATLLLMGIFMLLARGRKQPHRAVAAMILAAGVLAGLLVFWYNHTYAQPYYLFHYLSLTEILALDLLALWIFTRFAQRNRG